MKIHKYGVVILTAGPVQVEGWQVEREPNDPEDATTEQLLLAFAIHWAQERFKANLNRESMKAFREIVKRKMEERNLDASAHWPLDGCN